MVRVRIGIATGLTLLFLLWIPVGRAQEQNGWSSPIRLSRDGVDASEAFMVSDQYGYTHVFWLENSGSDNAVIMYSRFDGDKWTVPSDIMVVQPGGYTIGYLAADIDANGNLHLIWTGGNNGPAYYSRASAPNALSARDWSLPVRIDVPAYILRLLVDAEGWMHILFSNFYGVQPGIYYARSEDGGVTWSNSLWLDSDIPEDHKPTDLKFAMDESGGLHAAWTYLDLVAGITDMVRYARSVDDLDRWSSPFAIDEADESSQELRKTNVGMILQGQTVHVIWAGTEGTNREHRYSANAGLSWEESRRIFGDLHGEAIGDGLAMDADGRIHFVGQIRWPQAIWHAIWDQGRWTEPSIAYLIARDAIEPRGYRIHAHNVRLTVRGGNQLVMTFTSSPGEGSLELYAIHRILEDVSPVEPMPALSLISPTTEAPSLTESPAPQKATPMSIVVDNTQFGNPLELNATNSQKGFWIGVYPALALILLVIIVQQLRKN